MEFDVVGTASQGTALDVFGSSSTARGGRSVRTNGKLAWVSKTVATFQGDSSAVPVVPPLIPDDLEATWAVRWECHAEGCVQEECLGQSQASTLQVRSTRWLEVKREATWVEQCGEREEWIAQVDRYTGQERQTTGGDAPLFSIFAGANPGPENRSIDLLDRRLSLWCTDKRTKEVEQGKGWTVVFEGEACYDRQSGVLATMQYLKRWLFTGDFEGKTYDRQYFGDYEVYQQILTGQVMRRLAAIDTVKSTDRALSGETVAYANRPWHRARACFSVELVGMRPSLRTARRPPKPEHCQSSR